ncbi:MAG: hypothetical protein QF415_12780 [Candidatus Undinarchaeales archaeon]|nr:hypothetical protein [Candidatus Undinarchaeales archaeon]MDP7493912.1 hypothetical protein [Candidatus Undinarchaeales archaeon]
MKTDDGEAMLKRIRKLSKKRLVVPRIANKPSGKPAIIGDRHMQVKTVHCPQCGAPLEQDDLTDDGVCTCAYCNSLVRVGVDYNG